MTQLEATKRMLAAPTPPILTNTPPGHSFCTLCGAFVPQPTMYRNLACKACHNARQRERRMRRLAARRRIW